MSDADLEDERPWLPLLSAGPLLIVLPVAAAGGGSVSLWMIVAVVLAAGLAYRDPDSGRGLVALVLAGGVWVVAAPDSVSAGSLVVALLLLTSHVALALRATAPPATVLAADVVRRWALRSASVAAVTGVVYVVALAVEGLPQGAAGAAVAAGLGLVAAMTILLRVESVRGSPGDGGGGAGRVG